jgi:nucleoside-diphosphate-sugar epimerase
MFKKTENASQKPTALVTGATGFVGSHLARRLVREGWEVHILIRLDSKVPSAIEFSQMTKHIHDGSTSCMISCLEYSKPKVVFHLASLFVSEHSNQDINALIESNVLFGAQLLEAMNANNIKSIVNTGTSWQHFNNEAYNPVCLYAATKQAFEALMLYYIRATYLKAITLKLFDTYGPDDPRPKLFNLLNKASSSGEQLNMSEGNQMIDIVHIDDVVDAYLIAAHRLITDIVIEHECYAVSSGQPLRLRDLVERYSDITKKNVKVKWGVRPYRLNEVMNTWDKGQLLVNWIPKVSLDVGLKDVTN